MLVTEERLLDAAGRPRSPATVPGYHAGRPPRNRRALLRRQRADLRAPVVWPGRTNTASAARPRRRSETPFRSSPAPSRPWRRDGPGGRAAECHPAPARPRRPRRHVGLSGRELTTPRSSARSTRAERRRWPRVLGCSSSHRLLARSDSGSSPDETLSRPGRELDSGGLGRSFAQEQNRCPVSARVLAVTRAAEDDFRDRAPDVGERGVELVVAHRRSVSHTSIVS
jgi:hypothetical protein